MAPGFQQQSYGDPSQLLQRVGAGLEPFEPLAALAEGAYAASGSSDWLLPWALSLWRLNRHLEAMEVLDRAPGASQQTTEYQVMRGMVAESVDAIVTDLEMPGLDGSELCARAHDRFHHAPPFVLHTGAAQLLSRAARGRCAAVLDKPCDRRQMFDAVRHAAAGGAAARS